MVQIVAVSSLPVTTPHKPHHTRRAGSIHSVEMMIDSAREKYAKRDGLSIMTEFISIKPLTLRFSKIGIEKQFVHEHKERYYPRYRPTMIVIALIACLLALSDFISGKYSSGAIKLVTSGYALFLASVNKCVYKNEFLLTLTSVILVYLMLLTQLLTQEVLNEHVDPKTGRVVIEYSKLQLTNSSDRIGVVTLLYMVLGACIGLRFMLSIFISTSMLALCLISVWFSPLSLHQSISARQDTTAYVVGGFFFFNTFLLRQMEISERRDFRLTKRLAAENVQVQLQMENFSIFTKVTKPQKATTIVTPMPSSCSSSSLGKALTSATGTVENNSMNTTLATRSSVVAPGGVLSVASRINENELEVLDTIGCGSHGEVLKAKYKATLVAIKKIRGDIKEELIEAVGEESTLMADLRHPNIVMFMGVCLYPPMIIMEYCSRGSVFNVVHVQNIPLDWSLVLRILIDACHGMAFLHQHKPAPIIHHDLKSLNLLLDENWRTKISDFGLSKLKKKNMNDIEFKKPLGSVPWMAPEIFAVDQAVTEKADVYSIGIIIFELLTKSIPYPEIPMQGIPMLITKGKRPTDYREINMDLIPSALKELVLIMKQCWSTNPSHRPDFETIVQMLEEKICPLYFQGVPMADAILFPREKTQQQKEDEITQHNLEFNIDEKELTLGAKIGGGSYGAVFAGKWLGTDVAIKQLYFNSLPDKVLKEFHKECNLMRQFRHPNIVLFLGSCSKPPNLYLVTELLQKGSLFDIYHNENQSMNPIRHFGLVVQIAADMARGMAYLHGLNPPLIHRDLKSPNIMVDSHWVSKIGDFGLSRIKDETKTMTKCGSPLWVAPEVLHGERFSEGCDIYSFAIIVWEIIAWSEPYPNMSSKQVMKQVALNDLRPTIPPETPAGLGHLLTMCWKRNPKERPSFTNILEQLECIDAVHSVQQYTMYNK